MEEAAEWNRRRREEQREAINRSVATAGIKVCEQVASELYKAVEKFVNADFGSQMKSKENGTTMKTRPIYCNIRWNKTSGKRKQTYGWKKQVTLSY